MKALLSAICSVVLTAVSLASSPVPNARAAAVPRASIEYALVTGSNAEFLREPTSAGIENTYFRLPRTYFVQIVTPNYTDTLHKVRYRDLVGYVAASALEPVDYTPASVYPPTVTLRVNIDSASVNVRARPDHTSAQVVYTLPSDATGVEYYGVAAGTESGASGNAWYYVKLTPGSDSVVRGYLYAPYVLLESTIPAANDTSPIDPPDTDVPVREPSAAADADTEPLRIIAIVALCIPAVVIVCLIFTRPRKKKDKQPKYTN